MIEVIREKYLGKDAEGATDVSVEFPMAVTMDVTMRDAGRNILSLYDGEGKVVALFNDWDYATVAKEDAE